MLKKLFIKDYQNTTDSIVRIRYGKTAGIFGIITNAILGIMKLIIGFLSHSISIVADAANNISDMFTSILTIVGFNLSSKKADKTHPYGYARYEYIFGLIIAIVMLIMGILFARESIVKIIHPRELEISFITYIILLIAIILKSIQMFVYLDFAKSIKSKTLRANAIDTRNDIITTSVIFISMFVMETFKINVDGYLGLAVSLFVIISSIKMIKEVIDPLIGIVPSKKQVKEIKNKILSYDCVLGIHDLVIHNYGVHNDFVTVHVELDSKMSMIKAHDLMDEIENDFKEHMNLQLTIHMDPVIVGDKEIDKMKNKILKLLKELNSKIDIHDFRMIKSSKKTNILFDCVIPFDLDYSYKDIKAYLNENIEGSYEYYIEIDRPFC